KTKAKNFKNKQKGRLGLAEDLQLGSGQKSSRGSWLHVERVIAPAGMQARMQAICHNRVCPDPDGRNKVTLGRRQENLLGLKFLPCSCFTLLPACVIPKRGRARSSPLLNDSTNLSLGFIFIPPYQIKNRNSSACPGLEKYRPGTLRNCKTCARE
uniref:Uncharacterized protein n=1 Tax=Strix occidentalis caurina TaxID=311401 RepID=A0A8D0EHD1_STROC